MLLTSATLPDGRTGVDVRITGGLITEIGTSLPVAADETALDLSSRLLLPALAEPHSHLDKAFLSERIANRSGDLMGAILAMSAARATITLDDTIERAERAVRLLASNGATAIRTHADTTLDGGLTSVEALVEVRRRVADVCELQIVALASWPVSGQRGANLRALLREAIAAGADVVGGVPHLEDDPNEANDALLTLAAEAGLMVDLHTDETLDQRILGLEDLAARVVAFGMQGRVTASHCVSLGMQDAARQRVVADAVAAAQISVVALPHTNLFLQGRDHDHAMPRGLTAVKALRAAGVNVCAGADNLQDPFNPMGRGDPLETGSLMVLAGHLLPDEALHAVSGAARQAMGLPAGAVAVGEPADLIAIDAANAREALAFAPGGRLVMHRGNVVSGGEQLR